MVVFYRFAGFWHESLLSLLQHVDRNVLVRDPRGAVVERQRRRVHKWFGRMSISYAHVQYC